MQIFINETSLNSQFEEPAHFFSSLKVFLSSVKRISEIKNNKNIFKSDHLFYYTGIQGTYLETTLKTNRPLNDAFVQNIQLVNPKSWQSQKIHEDQNSYEYKNQDFVGTSVAELSERIILDGNLAGFLLNFSDSQFGNELKIDVLKNKENSIEVDCAITPESIEQWLIDNGYLNPDEVYDEKSGIAPADYQTVLRESAIFEKTNYPRNNGRIVYRKIGSSELWTVDNAPKHAGAKAHIEVFDETTAKHLGTSLYNEINLNTDHKKENRYINKG